MNALHKFTIDHITKKLNIINQKLSALHQKLFPKPKLLSQYVFRKGFVSVDHRGDVQGGYASMITSLIDFTFVRSLVGDAYSSIFGPAPYDPVTLFLLDLFRYIDDHPDIEAFLTVLTSRKMSFRTFYETITIESFLAKLGYVMCQLNQETIYAPTCVDMFFDVFSLQLDFFVSFSKHPGI